MGFGRPSPYSKDTTKSHDGHRVLHTGVGQPKFVDTSTAKNSFMLQAVVASRKNHITVRPERARLKFKTLAGLYLGGHGDLVSRVIIRITRVTIWVIGVINLLTKSP